MTKKTTYLGLTTYNTGEDSGSLVYNYINNVAGSRAGENLKIIDDYAGAVSGSLTNLSASIVTLNTKLVFATSAQVTAGSTATTIISPSALAQSDFGKRTVSITLNSSASLMGGEMGFFRVPSVLNGWILTEANLSCGGSSTSGDPSVSLYKMPHTLNPYLETSGCSMLAGATGSMVITSGLFDASGTISTSASSVFTQQKLRLKCTVSGTNTKYVLATLLFKKP